MVDHLTFGLAFAGYLFLCWNVILHLAGSTRRWLDLVMAVVVLLHVFLVWHTRFDWSLSFAWQKSPAGFLIFHLALVLLILATAAPGPWSSRWLFLAFPIVSCGAVGAAFRYDYVAHYRWPLVSALAATLTLAVWRRGLRGQQPNP